jgi:hypothetical protein
MLNMSPSSSLLECLDHIIMLEIVPSVDLEISVHLRNLGFNNILVACNDELLGVVIVLIWGVHNETELRNLSAVLLIPFEVINDPSN